MKFSTVLLGKRAELPVEMEYRGETLRFAMRPLDGTEEALVLERATDFARKRNASTIEPGNPLFDLGVMVNALALAAVDVDSPEDARQPYFDDGAEAVLGAFGPEEIAFLHARYELHQSSTSPTKRQMSPADMVGHLIEIASSDSELPFVKLRPILQWSLLRFSASQLLGSPAGKSLLSSLSATTPAS